EAARGSRPVAGAVLRARAGPGQPGSYQPGGGTDRVVGGRGPRAAAALPTVQQVGGTLEEHPLDGAALRAPRQVTVYRPPGPAGPLPGSVLADGQSARGFAHTLEPAIPAGDVPPLPLRAGPHAT